MARLAPPLHRCSILPSPWPGVYGTVTESAVHFRRHSHATFGFGLMEAGAQHSASGRGAVQSYAGDVMTTNPGEVHDGRPLGVASRRWRMVHIPVESMSDLTSASNELAIAQPVITDPELAGAACAAIVMLERWAAGSAHALECEEALVRAASILVQRYGTCRPARDPPACNLRIVRERVVDEVLPEPTLAELAALAGVGRFQLLRRFRSKYGVTPHGLRQQQRAERARRLISQGQPLADAAASSGFADQSHMTREFTRQFGFTPGAWQRATRNIVQDRLQDPRQTG